jgi:pyruvate formate lyase activating enzyme
LFEKNACTRCGACVNICPVQASSISAAGVVIDRDKCTGCGSCVDSCPAGARVLEGEYMTVDQVMEVVRKDAAMYRTSGGGITLSGGDPTMQPRFALGLLKKSKELGLHTAIETCGHTSWDVLRSLIDYTDWLFFDIKSMDSERHRQGTGYGNERILENARKAAALNGTMMVRTPMIPGFNDTKDDVEAILRFVTGELGLPAENFSLLRYNKYAEGKYERLDREKGRQCLEPQTPEYMDSLNEIIRAAYKKP